MISEADVLENVLPRGGYRIASTRREETPSGNGTEAAESLNDALMKVEREKLQEAVRRSKTTREAARYLGISQSTVTRKLKKHGLALP